jgi:hypothetical protein
MLKTVKLQKKIQVKHLFCTFHIPHCHSLLSGFYQLGSCLIISYLDDGNLKRLVGARETSISLLAYYL